LNAAAAVAISAANLSAHNPIALLLHLPRISGAFNHKFYAAKALD
jgi:hypothetical protein